MQINRCAYGLVFTFQITLANFAVSVYFMMCAVEHKGIEISSQ